MAKRTTPKTKLHNGHAFTAAGGTRGGDFGCERCGGWTTYCIDAEAAGERMGPCSVGPLRYDVRHDGKTIRSFDTSNEAHASLLRLQPMSISWAKLSGGWSVVAVYIGPEEI